MCNKKPATSSTIACREKGGRDGRGRKTLNLQSSRITEARIEMHSFKSSGTCASSLKEGGELTGGYERRDPSFRRKVHTLLQISAIPEPEKVKVHLVAETSAQMRFLSRMSHRLQTRHYPRHESVGVENWSSPTCSPICRVRKLRVGEPGSSGGLGYRPAAFGFPHVCLGLWRLFWAVLVQMIGWNYQGKRELLRLWDERRLCTCQW